MTSALLATAVAMTVLPHALQLRRAWPFVAAALWLTSLLARAATVVLVSTWIVLLVPRSGAFLAATQWCWHAVVPYVAAHLQLTGHGVGDAALWLPLGAVGASVVVTLYAIVRACRAVRRYLRRFAMGPGPRGSVIVPGRDVVLAAAGIARPKVLVSAGALLQLDDEELAVGLEHERGHIARRHRWLLLTGTLARAVGRPIPRAKTALAELRFHLERDADRWALSRLDDRLALASVICKAAVTAIPSTAATPLGGSDVVARVRELTGDPTGPTRSTWRTVRLAAVCAVAAAVAIASPVAGAMTLPPATGEVRHCPS
jgi:Zn-dependent protease with chaperone function